MNNRLKYFLVLFLLGSCQTAFAQYTAVAQFEYANTLFANGHYFDAITEYKRLLFLDSTKAFEYEANMRIGKSYKAGAKLDDAIKYFSIAGFIASSEKELYSSEIEIVRSNILRRTNSRAFQLLDDMEKKYSSKEITDSLKYWRGWVYIFADDWINASRTFAQISPDHELKIIADRVEKEKLSVTFATVISYILPGSGQIYSGEILSGLLSLGWNIISGYLTISAFNADRVFDGIALLSLLWQRFYRGNIQNAGKFAVEKNIEISNRTLKYLQNEFKGLKP
ncbi:MAG TPA: hypothetical protein PLZ15_00795 [Melioribacteraceae bacterium]|nr:hypothetical protein [Melioribacteraceae bacterium]